MKRMGMVIGLRAEFGEEYLRLHAELWPTVIQVNPETLEIRSRATAKSSPSPTRDPVSGGECVCQRKLTTFARVMSPPAPKLSDHPRQIGVVHPRSSVLTTRARGAWACPLYCGTGGSDAEI